jgi:homocitrate synthase NifV
VLPQLTKLYEKFVNRPVGNKKAIIGKNIFKVEAGIHADGIKKNPATYEAYDPSLVGGRTVIVMGKHSGKMAVKVKMEELGIAPPPDFVIDRLLIEIRSVCTDYGRSLKDDEFAKLAREVIIHEGNQIYR